MPKRDSDYQHTFTFASDDPKRDLARLTMEMSAALVDRTDTKVIARVVSRVDDVDDVLARAEGAWLRAGLERPVFWTVSVRSGDGWAVHREFGPEGTLARETAA